ncbi:MAG: MurR/RpiR family transcriptional regulator [Spirochaetaceae bacterium]
MNSGNEPSRSHGASCLLKVQGMRGNLNPMERKVADFVLEQPREAVSLTIDELANRVETSYATVTRFSKRVGYRGYKEFRSDLVREVLGESSPASWQAEGPIEPGAALARVCDAVFAFSDRVLKDSYEMLDYETIDAAVRALLEARRILFLGVGTSGISARYAYSKFFRLGLPCQIELDSVMSKMQCSLLEEGDVLFAISSSGRSREVLENVRVAKARGATVISLSDFAETPLSTSAQITLFTTPRNANLYKEIEMPLLIPQIAIIDSLYSCLGTRDENFGSIHARTKEVADESKL